MSTIQEDTPIKLHEKSRTYRFADGEIQLSKVTELVVRDSGTHRLKTNDGHLHIIAPGWLAIEIEDDGEWTV